MPQSAMIPEAQHGMVLYSVLCQVLFWVGFNKVDKLEIHKVNVCGLKTQVPPEKELLGEGWKGFGRPLD